MLPLFLLLPFLGALIFLFSPKRPGKLPWLIAVGVAGACLLVLAKLTMGWSAGEPIVFSRSWIPLIGLEFSLWLDGPALFWAWLVTGIGFLIFLYAGFYLDPDDSPWRFFGSMTLFMGAMLGVVVSRNVLLMFIFWELTSISSFLLIGHWHHKPTAQEGAMRALLVTGLGGAAILAALALVYWVFTSSGQTVSFDWDYLWEQKEVLTGHAASPWILGLFLIGAFTKSAQFPFHFWLPGAMEAPTPVSAFLHAATMVKAGIYLLGRLYPIFGDQMAWLIVLGLIGTFTMLVGGFLALLSVDLKQLLAYSTVSQLGLLVAYYGFGYGRLGTENLLELNLYLVASHAFFKGALFMLVGVIDHGTHTRDWPRLGGLFRKMPVTGVLTTIGCLSMMGAPLTMGFVAKELFLEAGLHLPESVGILKIVLPAIAVIASIFTVAYCLRMTISPFFGKPRDSSIPPHEGGFGLLFPPGLLIALCLLGGLYVPLLSHPIGELVRDAYYGHHLKLKVAFYPYLNLLTGISLGLLLVLGPAAFLGTQRIKTGYLALGSPNPIIGLYEGLVYRLLPWMSEWIARTAHSTSLQRNTTIILGSLVVLVAVPLLREGIQVETHPILDSYSMVALGTILVTAICLGVILYSQAPLVRLVAISPIGILVALMFILYRGPDLALTQIMVEVVSLIVILLMLFRLPQRIKTRETRRIPLPAVIAVAGGLLVGLLCYEGATSELRRMPILPSNPTHADFYTLNSKHGATPGSHGGGGNNIVNVILVDFRGADTLGEITVLAVAALGAFCLLEYRRKRNVSRIERAQPDEISKSLIFKSIEGLSEGPAVGRALLSGTSIILRKVAHASAILIVALAIILFFAGHNEPGGGFIAGLLTSTAAALYMLAFRVSEKEQLWGRTLIDLIPIGLMIAVGTGLVAMTMGAPFLTSAHTEVHLPLLGPVEVASAVMFDLGVFLTVVGVTVSILKCFSRS